MKKVGSILLLLALGLTVDIARELVLGTASVAGPGRYASREAATRENKPDLFNRIFLYETFRALLCFGAGYACISIERAWDARDPFSPTNRGTTDIQSPDHDTRHDA